MSQMTRSRRRDTAADRARRRLPPAAEARRASTAPASCPAARTGRAGRTTRRPRPASVATGIRCASPRRSANKPGQIDAAGREDRDHPRQGQGLRAERPLPAPRRPAQLRQPAVPGHAVVRLPRLDVRPGDRRAVRGLTDGPESPICGKVTQPTYDVEERLGMVWVYVGDGEVPHPIDEQLPEELVGERRQSSGPGSSRARATGASRARTASTRATPSTCTAPRCGGCSSRCRPGTSPGSCSADAGSTASRRSCTGRPTSRAWASGPSTSLVQAQAARGPRGQQHRQHRSQRGGQPGDRRSGLPRLRVGEHAGHPAHRLPEVHPLRVVRAGRRGQPPVRRRDGRVPRGTEDAAVLRRSTSARSAGCSTASSPARTSGWSRSPTRRRRSSTAPTTSLLKWRKLAEDITEERIERLAEQGLEPTGRHARTLRGAAWCRRSCSAWEHRTPR